MEKKFLEALAFARAEAQTLGVRQRPATLADARRLLSSKRLRDGFTQLEKLKRLDLTLEALAVDRRFTALFSDAEANEALTRLLEAGYRFVGNVRG